MAEIVQPFVEELLQLITKAIKVECEREFDRLQEDMLRTMHMKKREIVAGVVLNITNQISMQDFDKCLRIEIINKNTPNG